MIFEIRLCKISKNTDAFAVFCILTVHFFLGAVDYFSEVGEKVFVKSQIT